MITLKAPIELKNRTDFVHNNDTFSERITGSYELMGLEIGAEELLHLVSTPPEVYIAEGGSTTTVGNTLIQSRNEEKLNIINNVLNRIMLSADAALTYQDRTYITDVLHKIGIKDDRKFMNEVKRMIDESRLEQNFIDNYLELSVDEDNIELRQETLSEAREIVERGLAEGFRLKEERLSREIMTRLQTGAIYQIVANFNKSLNESNIGGAQFLVSEQENTAQTILIQNFLNEMQREGANLIYRTEITNEAPDEDTGMTVSGSTETRSYESNNVYEKELMTQRTEDRRSTEYIGSENMLDIIKTEQENTTQKLLEQNYLNEIQREGAELTYRTEITNEAPDEDTGMAVSGNTETRIYESKNVYEKELMTHRTEDRRTTEYIGSATMLDIVKNLYHSSYETISRGDTWMEFRNALYRSTENTFNRVTYQASENRLINRTIAEYPSEVSVLREYNETEEEPEQVPGEASVEFIEQQLDIINQGNLQNVERYQQMIQVLKQLQPRKTRTGGKDRTMRDALFALEDGNEILRRFDEADGEEEQERKEVFHEITRLFPDNAAQIFNIVEQYMDNPGSLKEVSVVSNNIDEAAEEIMKLQQRRERQEQEVTPVTEINRGNELVFRREDRLSSDEIEEIFEGYRRQENRQNNDIFEKQEINETQRVNSTTVTQNQENNLNRLELENIQELVNRGVRSQVGTISEQVIQKLEKRLRNEKSRRGI
ncbi:MAG: hypothetical protein K6G03_11095 [Lachnospiraceae bacterium]|nr:hypothetical protein [Lachnospiraceae bacterium]